MNDIITKYREQLIIAGIIVLVFIVSILITNAKKETMTVDGNSTSPFAEGTAVERDNTMTLPKKNEDAPATGGNNAAPVVSGKHLKANPDTYQKALATYGDWRIQIEHCKTIPTNKMLVKNGTTVLLDGFSADPQKITIGTKSIILDGYDAQPFTISVKNPPQTIYLSCEQTGTQQFNALEINVVP